ncbi:polysaccharide deacetylase family protein [Haloarcula sp. KBTZ06]|uniref:polysaccharide deacetylase family protein n=1 Tax=Haloarcula sp. KBTZ06 TaxID=3402682 RepID=UPI001244C850|nr:polysaccharide deacetylase [Haloarcula sp. CBA1131]
MRLTGSVVISLEVELGWAKHDLNEYDHLSEDRRTETRTLSSLLDWCESAEVPITFDVVGHLLLDTCGGNHEGRPGDGWFEADPGTDVESDPLFYAPDMINAICSSPVPHDVCTHTFSHTPCGEVTSETVDWELRRAQDAHDEFGIPWSRAFVPPRHSSAPERVLKQNGIDTVRTPEPCRLIQMNAGRRLYHNALSPYQPSDGRVCDGTAVTPSTPYISLGCPNLPMGQIDPHPVFRLIPVSLRKRWHLRRLYRGVDRAIRSDATLHVWSHLWDLSNAHQRDIVERFIAYAGARQEQGEIDVLTMADFGRAIRQTN